MLSHIFEIQRAVVATKNRIQIDVDHRTINKRVAIGRIIQELFVVIGPKVKAIKDIHTRVRVTRACKNVSIIVDDFDRVVGQSGFEHWKCMILQSLTFICSRAIEYSNGTP